MIYRILKTAGLCRSCVERYAEIVRETPLYLIVEASQSDIELLQKQHGVIAIPEEKRSVKKHQLLYQEGETITVDEIKTLVGFDVLPSYGLNDDGIIIAVLGTGVNVDVLPSEIASRVEVIDYTDEGTQDDVNHGTAVTYLLGALTKNAQIKHLKVIGKDLSITSQALLDAFEYAYWNCHIANVSWGFADDPCNYYKKYNGLMQFIAWADPPFYFVASAGNNDAQPNAIDFPAASEYAIAVGAIDKNGIVAEFSSIGAFECDGITIPKPDVATYGVNVEVIDANGEVTPVSGTSFSSPIVAAFIAWLYNPYAHQMRLDILRGHRINPHCQCEGWSPDYGYGVLRAFVNAPPAVQMAFEVIPQAFALGLAVAVPIVAVKSIAEALRRR